MSPYLQYCLTHLSHYSAEATSPKESRHRLKRTTTTIARWGNFYNLSQMKLFILPKIFQNIKCDRFNFIPSRDVNLARDMQGFSEMMLQKDLDMCMIKASAYNCSCWRRILPTCRCDLTAHLSRQWIQHQLINSSNPFP